MSDRPATLFSDWFDVERRRRDVPDRDLRAWLASEVRARGVECTDRQLRNLIAGHHEPRRKLRAALMAVTGLPVQAFALPMTEQAA